MDFGGGISKEADGAVTGYPACDIDSSTARGLREGQRGRPVNLAIAPQHPDAGTPPMPPPWLYGQTTRLAPRTGPCSENLKHTTIYFTESPCYNPHDGGEKQCEPQPIVSALVLVTQRFAERQPLTDVPISYRG